MLSRDIFFIFNVNHASNGPTSIEINNNQTYCIMNSSGLGYSYYTQTQLLGFIGTGIFIAENKSNLKSTLNRLADVNIDYHSDTYIMTYKLSFMYHE